MGEETLRARIVLLSPARKILLITPITVKWGENVMFFRIYLNFDKLPVTTPGLCWFAVEQQKTSKDKKSRWVSLARIPLFILDVSGVPEDTTHC